MPRPGFGPWPWPRTFLYGEFAVRVLCCSRDWFGTVALDSLGVSGRAAPMFVDGHSDFEVGGDVAEGSSFCVTTGDFLSTVSGFDLVDLLLLERLLSFSPLPVMTNSGWLCNALLCLRLMKNQNNPKEANNTTATGTTMAGIKVDRLELDFAAAALVVAAAEVVEVVVCIVDDDEAAAAEVREAYSAELVIVLVTSVVNVVSPAAALCWKVRVSVMVVRPDTAWAVTRAPEASAVPTALVPIDCGRVAVGLSMREGRESVAWAARLCKPKPCRSILPGCMTGRME